MVNYKIRHARLNPNHIFNWLAPRNVTMWNAFATLRDTWWEDETVKLRQECEQLWISEFDKLTGHFSNLEQSILQQGIKHPVKVVTGLPFEQTMTTRFPEFVAPPEMQSDIPRLLSTHQFGGSRLLLAQKYNIEVPCLIYDFYDAYPQYEEIDIHQAWNNQRDYYRLHTYPNGIQTLVVRKHYHLDTVNVVPRDCQAQATTKVQQYLQEIGKI